MTAEGRKGWLLACFVCGGLSAVLASRAAGKPEYEMPAKDVVVMVDVSGSMAPVLTQVNEARRIISAIVSGTGGFPDGWKPVTIREELVAGPPLKDRDASAIRNVREAFAPYLGNAPDGPLPPLVKAGNRLSVKLIGNFNTVVRNSLQKGKFDYEPRRTLTPFAELTSAEGFERALQESWPDSFMDQSTCYTFAVARVAQEMRGRSYYLFTVSDEKDEPSYSADPVPGEVKRDREEMWRPKYEKGNWGRNAIDITISEGLRMLSGSERSDLNQIRKTNLIARLEGPAEGVKINWYYGGQGPREIVREKKPVPDPAVAAAPAPAAPASMPAPPAPAFRFLGTAAAGGEDEVRMFDYANAMVVYQIDHPGGRIPQVQVSIGERTLGLEELRPEEDAVTSRAWGPNGANTLLLDRLGREVMDGGIHILTLKAEGLKPLELRFRVLPPSTAWITWLGWSSAALALGIFIYSWRSLRHADTTAGA